MSCSLTNPYFHHLPFILVTSDCCQWGAEVSVHDAWSPYCLRGAWNGGLLGLGDIITWFQQNIIFHRRLSVDIVITDAWWWWRLRWCWWRRRWCDSWQLEMQGDIMEWRDLTEDQKKYLIQVFYHIDGDVPNIIQFYQIKLFSHGCQFSTRCGHRAMCCLI